MISEVLKAENSGYIVKRLKFERIILKINRLELED